MIAGPRRWRAAWLLVIMVATTTISTLLTPAEADPSPLAVPQPSDFDGDGFADLVVGGQGAIYVTYGSAEGLDPTRNQRWTTDDLPSASRVTQGGSGTTGTGGDFNGDGFSDLAIQEEGLHVLYGSPSGLTVTGSVYFPIGTNSGGVPMAAGNFGKGRFTDLAIGAPIDYAGTNYDGEVVTVLYGSDNGLTMAGHQTWTEDSRGIPGTSEDGGHFGDALAAADLGKSTYDDLAIGIPEEYESSGAVTVIYGTDAGLTAAGNQRWTPHSKGLPQNPFDQEGTSGWMYMSLAVGHFAGGTHADLAIGAPSRAFVANHGDGNGTVNVIYGSASGLTAEGSQLWTERTPGVLGKIGFDGFGATLAAGNYGRDSDGRTFTDLAIGAPDNGPNDNVRGAVHVLYGSSSGLAVKGNQLWKQNVPGVPGRAEESDGFGTTITYADFGRNATATRYADLAVGVPGESLGGDTEQGGLVHVFYGGPDGLRTSDMQLLTQEKLSATPEREDFSFGLALTASSSTDEHN